MPQNMEGNRIEPARTTIETPNIMPGSRVDIAMDAFQGLPQS